MFGEARDRQPEGAIEDGETEALDDAELQIREPDVDLDGLRHRGQALAIREVEGVRQHQDDQQPRAITLGKRRRNDALDRRQDGLCHRALPH